VLNTCRALGYPVHERGAASICRGSGHDLVVETAEVSRGITNFVTALQQGVPRRTDRMGKLTVELESRTATFTLAP
jgi:hypothetical protein